MYEIVTQIVMVLLETYLFNALLCNKALRAFKDRLLKITVTIILFRFQFEVLSALGYCEGTKSCFARTTILTDQQHTNQ